MLFCPTCANLLVISSDDGQNKWTCNTCPYEFPITDQVCLFFDLTLRKAHDLWQMTSRVKLTRKRVDDVLGGGLPLSCSMLSLAPDLHSSYGELVQKYFIAQGLSSGHTVCVVNPSAKDFVQDIMWTPRSVGAPAESKSSQAMSNDAEDGDDTQSQEHDQKIKIAWRYEHTKQFQTTIDSSSL